MRIVQIIDSLEAGGAERMAVNFANTLVEHTSFSGLVVTRKEGPLLKAIDSNCSYLHLKKKRTVDIKVILKLRNYIVNNKVDIVHAHGTSFFIAVLLKLTYPKIKIIWHEHYGARVKQSRIDNLMLFFSSVFFSSVFVVNHQLEAWVKENLFQPKVFYIPNFATSEDDTSKTTFLRGVEGKRIVCLANLKNPKNHLLILRAFNEMGLNNLGWSLHLIGKEYNDSYSENLRNFIIYKKLESSVFIYGSQNDIQHILSQATIGILSSTDEGFPVSLLEYGLAQLSVISTNVGNCTEIIKEDVSGLLFDPFNILDLQGKLSKMIANKDLRDDFGINLKNFVLEHYSKEKVLELLIVNYNML
jgi:glycosyltransferase involved in cell wall biosynthesis